MVMFGTQKEFVTDLQENLFDQFRQTIDSFDHVLSDFIVEKQLFDKGIDGDGKRLPGYARSTIRLKLRKGQPVDRTTTRDEGDFHASIQVDAFSDRFEVSSDVEHDIWILRRYGRNILKITKENFEDFMITYFLPNFMNHVNSKFAR